MPAPTPAASWRPKLAGAGVLAAALAAAGWLSLGRSEPDVVRANDPPAAPAAPPGVGGLALFATWPADRRPDLALVLSGQTYGYLSPCGCSRPQKGGLERRANLFAELRAKGWPVVGLDLGDVAPSEGVERQNMLKYATTMKAMAEMGYAAVGLGEYDFASQIWNLLTAYTVGANGRPPLVLAANLVGVERGPGGQVKTRFPLPEAFPAVANGRPMVDAVEVVARPGEPAFGVVSVIGPQVADKVVARDPSYDFARDAAGKVSSAAVLDAALKAMAAHPANPDLKVMLYVGPYEDAKAAAEAFPQFQLVLCQSDSSEPPAFPTALNAGKTQLVQVGHKGQNVGVVGAFRAGAGGYDLKYQLVPLGEEYLTPPGDAAAKANPVLQMLEGYSAQVKDQNLLALHTAKPLLHPAQIQHPTANVRFVGSDACAACHPAEHAVWSKAAHSHAYEALEKRATRPGNRQFDGECLVCHTVGMKYQTGFTDAVKTPNLKNNGCENCHGPGSAHSAQPDNKAFFPALSPWKVAPGDKLPDAATMAAIAAAKLGEREAAKAKLPANVRDVVNAVDAMCYTCHNTENDPKFDLFKAWPKVVHSNLKGAAGVNK